MSDQEEIQIIQVEAPAVPAEEVEGVQGGGGAGAPEPPVIDLFSSSDEDENEGDENDDEAPNAVDGDEATSWPTQSYNDQLGPPPGLKTGVGLALDLGGEQTVTAVDLTLVGSPTRFALYLFDESPTSVADATPVARARARRTSANLTLEEPITASYAVVWLTSLPAEGSLFRGRVAEVVVQAAPRP